MGITATDTACLSGTYPLVALRKYGVKSFKTDFFKELGLRILIKSIAQAFAKHDAAFIPLISYAFEHYYRVFGRIEEGKRVASENLRKNLGYVAYCKKCLNRSISKEVTCKCDVCGARLINIGPVWTGEIEDYRFVKKAEDVLPSLDWLKTSEEIKKLLSFLENESKVSLYYDVHKVCKVYGMNVPSFEVVIKKLRDAGYSVFRTHFCRTGIKTNANLKTFLNALECTKRLNSFTEARDISPDYD